MIVETVGLWFVELSLNVIQELILLESCLTCTLCQLSDALGVFRLVLAIDSICKLSPVHLTDGEPVILVLFQWLVARCQAEGDGHLGC